MTENITRIKATLTFDLPDHAHEHLCAIHGGLMLSTLWEIDQHLRRLVKHPPEGTPENTIRLAEEIRREYIADVLAVVGGD